MALFSNAVQLVTPVFSAAEGGGFHPPSISDFFPEVVLFADTPFAMNRIMIIRVIMTALLLLLFWLGTRNMKVVPSRGQSLTEMALDFVRVNIAEDLLGKVDGRRFLPILVSIFFTILAFNVTGIIPIMESLLLKGLPLGTTLAFCMSTVAVSLPEVMMLKQVMRWKLLAVFLAMMLVIFTLVGWLFNALQGQLQLF